MCVTNPANPWLIYSLYMVKDEHKIVHILTQKEFISSQAHKIALP